MSPSLLLPLALVAALLALAAVLLWRRRRRGIQAAAPEPDPEVPDVEEEARRLLEGTPELRALAETLGFSPRLERHARELLAEMRGLVRAHIPDFEAFRQALEGTAASPSPAPEAAPRRTRYQPRDDALLREVLAVRDDPQKVLEILDRDPVGELLPFVEEIPFEQEGKVVWRSPVELSLIRKRPADPRRFGEALARLERLLRAQTLRRPETLRNEVLEAAARLRRALERDTAYLPTPLRALEERVDEWLRSAPPAARRQLGELMDLLSELLATRHQHGFAAGPPPTLDEERAALLQSRAREHAQRYTRAPWMHTPPLTDLVLVGLLASELAPIPQTRRRRPGSPGGLLARVWGEVDSGCYDPEETARRLRQMEDQGSWVHSLVYALLRLTRPAAGPRPARLPHRAVG